jgi:hypothetical protein
MTTKKLWYSEIFWIGILRKKKLLGMGRPGNPDCARKASGIVFFNLLQVGSRFLGGVGSGLD